VCTVFVDGLRYDVAVRLKERLAELGKPALSVSWTSMPSVTASGKPWCSPVRDLVAGTKEDADFQPRVAADGKPLSAYNFRKLLAETGVQVLDKHESGDPQGAPGRNQETWTIMVTSTASGSPETSTSS
jgi:hypothetical protein